MQKYSISTENSSTFCFEIASFQKFISYHAEVN